MEKGKEHKSLRRQGPTTSAPQSAIDRSTASHDLFICLSLKLSARKVSRLLLSGSRSTASEPWILRRHDERTMRRTYKEKLRTGSCCFHRSMEIERYERPLNERASAHNAPTCRLETTPVSLLHSQLHRQIVFYICMHV